MQYSELISGMNTEEASLKKSFKKMPTDSGAASCTAKAPMLARSGEKPTHRASFIYHPRVPKRKGQLHCQRVKTPWIVRSAVAFALVIVVVIFASLHSRASTNLESADNKMNELESLVKVLQQNISDLEKR